MGYALIIRRNNNILPSITALTNRAMMPVRQPPKAKVFIQTGTGNMQTAESEPGDTTRAASSGASCFQPFAWVDFFDQPPGPAAGGRIGGIAAGIAAGFGSLFGRGNIITITTTIREILE
jgi:hypothetical protein